jgi:membrane fusion protein, multidrug efflux system
MQKSVRDAIAVSAPRALPAPGAEPTLDQTAKFGRLNLKALAFAGALCAGLALLSVLLNWWTTGRHHVTTDDASISARTATLAPKVAGYITEVTVADHASVKTGDVIARIDTGDYQLAIRAARDTTDTQRAAIARIGQQMTAQQSLVDQAKAQVSAAQAASLKASQDMKRQQELATRKINSAQALDQAQAANEQGKANAAAAAAGLQAAIATVGVLDAQRTEAASLLRQAETALVKAERDLTFTEIRAPFDGVIGNRAMQVGDFVQPAQRLASLVPAHAIYIDANFKETQVARIKPGQRAMITVDALGDAIIEGVVESVSPASGSVFSLLPPDNATGNFTKIVQRVPVRIALPAHAVQGGQLRLGMSVIVRVDTRQRRENGPAPGPAIDVTPSALTAR